MNQWPKPNTSLRWGRTFNGRSLLANGENRHHGQKRPVASENAGGINVGETKHGELTLFVWDRAFRPGGHYVFLCWRSGCQSLLSWARRAVTNTTDLPSCFQAPLSRAYAISKKNRPAVQQAAFSAASIGPLSLRTSCHLRRRCRCWRQCR